MKFLCGNLFGAGANMDRASNSARCRSAVQIRKPEGVNHDSRLGSTIAGRVFAHLRRSIQRSEQAAHRGAPVGSARKVIQVSRTAVMRLRAHSRGSGAEQVWRDLLQVSFVNNGGRGVQRLEA